MDLKDIRQEYLKNELKIDDLNSNPIDQFKIWFEKAEEDLNLEPAAMTISTIDENQSVNSRIVLLKEVVNNSFRFFTNYNSSKGNDIKNNPNVSLLFFWQKSEKQIRIKGKAKKSPTHVSTDYFKSRPTGSQAGAIASNQSEVILTKDELIYEFEKTVKSSTLNRPDNWGGYDIEPYEIEFWQGGKNRLHDRFRYKLEGKDWKIERLAP